MSVPLLELEHLSYRYPDGTTALDNITLSIEKGKKIALLGNNGAGKSTLFLHLNGILKPTSGVLHWKGVPLSYSRQDIRKLRHQVGIVFQNPDSQLFAPSVYEDIQYGPRNLKYSPEERAHAVEQALTVTETTDLKDKPPHFLSLGQKKRVAIAGVLAMNPELIVLDEPTAGLDSYYAKKIMDVLYQFSTPDKTVILSTHDVNLAFEWADEVILMNNGRVAATGCPVKVFQDEDILIQCHLEKPWVMEVYEKLHNKKMDSLEAYPRSKNELMSLLDKM